MIRRDINILLTNSFFLFGARGTGKTTLLKELFTPDQVLRIDLLDPTLYAKLQADPGHLQSLIAPAINRGQWIIIDEVQKVPELLDIVHMVIERDRARFALTGSSARKLRRGAANLLAGRAFVFRLYPLLAHEIGESFDLAQALEWGTLPGVWLLPDAPSRSLFLQAYAETYLREEIVMEQVVRNLPPFRRFLNVAGQMSGKVINYAKIAADCSTDPSNVRNYFQILEDTLIGFFLEPFHHSIRKRQRQSPKFFFVDSGVTRALSGYLGTSLHPSTSLYGDTFEAFVITQIRAHLEYSQLQYQLSYLTTKDGAEVDLIIERAGRPTMLIEIKSGSSIRREELRTLNTFAKELTNSQALCLYGGSEELLIDQVLVCNWRQGIARVTGMTLA